MVEIVSSRYSDFRGPLKGKKGVERGAAASARFLLVPGKICVSWFSLLPCGPCTKMFTNQAHYLLSLIQLSERRPLEVSCDMAFDRDNENRPHCRAPQCCTHVRPLRCREDRFVQVLSAFCTFREQQRTERFEYIRYDILFAYAADLMKEKSFAV